MKKIILATISLAALAMLGSSCQKPELGTEAPEVNNGQTLLIAASAEGATKATEANKVFKWEATDQIDLVTLTGNYAATLKTGAGEKNATFEATGVTGTVNCVAYPVGLVAYDDYEEMYAMSYPTSADNYTSGSVITPMLGKATVAEGVVSASLEHLCGLVEVNASNMQAGVNKMVFTALDPKMTYHNGTIMDGSNFSAKEMVEGKDSFGMIMSDVMGVNYEFTFNFDAVSAGAEMKFFVPIAANSEFGATGFKVAFYNGETLVEEKTFPLPAAGYTITRANILRGLNFEMKDAPVLEFAADYSDYKYHWMGGTFQAEDRKLSVNSNIEWTVSSNRDWARPAVNDEGKIVVTLDQNNAPGARKFTITVTPKDESLASLAKSVTMTEATDWTGGSGWTINDDGTATITGTVSGNSNFNTYYFSSSNTAHYQWNFSKFDITAGNFLIQHWPDNVPRIVVNLKSDGTLAFRVGNSEKSVNLLSHTDSNKRLNNLDGIKSIKIGGFRWNSNWRVFINDNEYISISYDEIGQEIWPSSYGSFCFWTGVQDTTGTVTIDSFVHTSSN